MIRAISLSVLAAALCTLQSGCCCCRLPLAFRPAPIVVNPPPIVFEQPNPFPQNDPFKDAFKDFGKDFPKNDNNPFKDNVGIPNPPSVFVYERSTGKLKQNDQVLGVGYSGKGAARNNAAMQAQRDGPIPLGEYLITGRRNDFKLGDHLGLLPVAGGNYFNRFPGETFAIIPETNPPNNPPSGCFIVIPANVLNAMNTPPLSKVQVVN